MTATLSMEIPRDVLESARMNVSEAKLELAIALFAAQPFPRNRRSVVLARRT